MKANLKILVLGTAIVLAPLAAFTTELNFISDGDNFSRATLPNGIKLLYNYDNTTSLSGLRILIAGGILTENENINGITNLMTKLLLKGNDRMTAGQIAARLEFLGAQVSADCYRDYSALSIVALSENLSEVMEIVNRSLSAPQFPEEELQKLKVEVEGLIKTENDNQTQSSSNLFWRTAYGNNSYGLPILGTVQAIRRITASDIKSHYKKLIGGNNIIIAISTDLPEQRFGELVSILNNLQSQSTTVNLPEGNAPVSREGFLPFDRNQSFIFMGYPLPYPTKKELAIIGILNEIMGANVGSRLWYLRQKEQLAYSVYTQAIFGKFGAVFRAAIGTDTAKVQIALASLKRELLLLYQEGITAPELADARLNLKNRMIYQIDRKSVRANFMALYEYLGYGYRMPGELIKEADKIRIDEVNDYIKAHLPPEKTFLSIVGKK